MHISMTRFLNTKNVPFHSGLGCNRTNDGVIRDIFRIIAILCSSIVLIINISYTIHFSMVCYYTFAGQKADHSYSSKT